MTNNRKRSKATRIEYAGETFTLTTGLGGRYLITRDANGAQAAHPRLRSYPLRRTLDELRRTETAGA